MTPSKKEREARRERRDRHGQTISNFPKRKPPKSGKRKPTPIAQLGYQHGYFLELVVRECVTDPAEAERLLALADDATTEEVHAAVRGA